MSTVILRVISGLLTPIVVALSLYFLLRGHNAPGGGFIGALIAGTAVVLQYLANGAAGIRRFLPVGFETLLGLGLLLAVGTGLVGLVTDGAFLSSRVWTWDLPVLGQLKVATSLAFDFGVYLIVLAVIVAVVRHLGESGE
jgi:multicomponent Na+:H+ antiporter subunit A